MNLLNHIRTVTLFLAAFSCLQLNAAIILLDPGHGGEDKGAKAITTKGEIMEKDLSLKLSQKIFEKLKRMGHTVVLSRSLDRTVTLDERAQMAEKLSADIFISIHFNSSTTPLSAGFETYYLDNHSDVAVKKVEQAENNSGLSGDALIIHQIITDLVVDRTVKTSRELAGLIHTKIKGALGPHKMKDRGVRPGLFYVLALAKRPGLLLEVGFISNPKELQKMSSDHFQDDYAQAVANGINQFFGTKKRGKIPLF